MSPPEKSIEPPGRFPLHIPDPRVPIRCKRRGCAYQVAHRCGKCWIHCVCHA